MEMGKSVKMAPDAGKTGTMDPVTRAGHRQITFLSKLEVEALFARYRREESLHFQLRKKRNLPVPCPGNGVHRACFSCVRRHLHAFTHFHELRLSRGPAEPVKPQRGFVLCLLLTTLSVMLASCGKSVEASAASAPRSAGADATAKYVGAWRAKDSTVLIKRE